MITHHRAVQLGVFSAAAVIVVSLGVLISQAVATNSSDSQNTQMTAPAGTSPQSVAPAQVSQTSATYR